jgi:hypothetical protein
MPQLVQENPDFDRRKFLYRLSRAEYEKEWGTQYQKPGWRTKLLAFFVRILPKIGPLKTVDITLPSPTTEDLYIKSVNETVDSYKSQLNLLRQRGNQIALPNRDFDTGNLTRPDEYRLADEAYAKLVQQLAAHKFNLVTPELQANIMAFYSNRNPKRPPSDKLSADEWRRVESAVDDLKSLHPGQ